MLIDLYLTALYVVKGIILNENGGATTFAMV